MTDPSADATDPESAKGSLGRLPDGSPVSRSVIDTVLGSESIVEQIDVDAPPVVRRVAGGRHELRERAIHLLYEVEIKDLPVEQLLREQVLAPDDYTERLVRGVSAHREELDAVIGGLARGWTVERMPTMDLMVLRVACYELAFEPEVPRGVVLAEAVELASHYGTDDSSVFVNGLLSAAADELRPA